MSRRGPAIARRRVAGDLNPPGSVPNLEIHLTDAVTAGRIMLRIDDGADAGKMLEPQTESSPGGTVRRLSIPPGRHAIEVTLLGADGSTEAGSTIEGTLTESGIAILRIDHLPDSGERLDLTWISPEASAGVSTGDR